MHVIQWLPRAAREVQKLDHAVAARILAAVSDLALDPRPAGCTKLSGIDLWRIRIGDDRVIYDIRDAELRVIIIRVAHRKDVYR